MRYEIEASHWINTDAPLSLASLRGRVTLVTVFQMLCPGCTQFSLPQARNLYTIFARDDLAVIGMHSVFEHHHVMTPDALRVFAREYRLQFPIAIDRSQEGSSLPATMSKWALKGTPTLMVFDRAGELALQYFGHLDDLRLGAVLGELIALRSSGGIDAARVVQSTDSGPVCSAI